jgi:eukaryotic-like serine/threonine-protein kinase
VGTVTPQLDEAAPPGVVLAQQYPAATPLEKGTTIDLVVSSGPAPRITPEVTGLTFDEAAAAVAGVQLLIERADDAFSNDVEAGRVISQEPVPGTEQPRDTGVVRVVVSKGPDVVTVPDVSGSSLDAAIQELRNAGLREGDVSGRAGRNVAVTSPRAGAVVLRNSRVDLVLG